jgi:HEAT repeat protein
MLFSALKAEGRTDDSAFVKDGYTFRLHETLRLTTQLKEAPDWERRRAAFDALVQLGMSHKPSHTAPRDGIRRLASSDDPRGRESLVQALIAAVAAENQACGNSTGAHHTPFPREEAELRVDLLWALSDLRDPRSTDVLLDAVNSSNIVVAALASFGDKSLPKVIDRLNAKPDKETKLSLMLVIRQMGTDRSFARLSSDSKATVIRTLLAALKDRDPLIRQTGCKGLALIADPSTIPDLQRVAAKDPETSNKSGHITYPIRDEAKEAIQTILTDSSPPKKEEKAKPTV